MQERLKRRDSDETSGLTTFAVSAQLLLEKNSFQNPHLSLQAIKINLNFNNKCGLGSRFSDSGQSQFHLSMQGFEDFHPSSFSQGGSFPSSGMQYLDGLRNIGAESGSSRIFLMGTKRSGKSSIEKVVFHKMSPHETLFLESTADVRVREVRNNPLVDLQILDFPGGFDFSEEDDIDPEKVFQYCGALVFVIDSQDEPHLEAIEYIVKIAEMAYRINPKIFFEIVIHKVDGDSTVANERKVSECKSISSMTLFDNFESVIFLIF